MTTATADYDFVAIDGLAPIQTVLADAVKQAERIRNHRIYMANERTKAKIATLRGWDVDRTWANSQVCPECSTIKMLCNCNNISL